MRIENHSFFRGFDSDARKTLLSAAKRETYPSGTLLFREHDAADCVFLILTGAVQLIKGLDAGNPIPIARIGPNDYLGDMGVIDATERSTGARTVGQTRLARIPAKTLLNILETAPADVSLGFFRQLSHRLRNANHRFVEQVLRKEKLALVGEMARSIIHDFKNAMAGVHGMAELIKIGGRDEKKIDEYCDILMEEVDHMNGMVQDLLEFARGEARLVREELNIADLFGKIQRLNAEPLRLQGVEISVGMVDVMISADPTRLLRVLQNLVSNAVQAFPEEGGQIRLEAQILDPDMVEVRIIDNGPGIPKSIRETLFQPFVSASRHVGAGLGMAIVKKIVEAHGGKVSFVTDEGKGTTFFLRLPTSG